MAVQEVTEVDLELARKWFNVGEDVYSYQDGDEDIELLKTRADIALADYKGKMFFIETRIHDRS